MARANQWTGIIFGHVPTCKLPRVTACECLTSSGVFPDMRTTPLVIIVSGGWCLFGAITSAGCVRLSRTVRAGVKSCCLAAYHRLFFGFRKPERSAFLSRRETSTQCSTESVSPTIRDSSTDHGLIYCWYIYIY